MYTRIKNAIVIVGVVATFSIFPTLNVNASTDIKLMGQVYKSEKSCAIRGWALDYNHINDDKIEVKIVARKKNGTQADQAITVRVRANLDDSMYHRDIATKETTQGLEKNKTGNHGFSASLKNKLVSGTVYEFVVFAKKNGEEKKLPGESTILCK